MPNEFTALHSIQAPGTSVLGYSRGMPVSADVVGAWGLVVGEAADPDADVVEGDLPNDAPAEVLVPRPDDGANRAAWESYAIANGTPAGEVAEMSMEDLQAVGPKTQDPAAPSEAVAMARPADSAPKADWVAYAKRLGADEKWADASSTTKADLQAYEAPVPGDTVAVAATEANQG